MLPTSKSHDSGSREPALIPFRPPTSNQSKQDAILRAGFVDRLYPFHALRHCVIINVYRKSRDLFRAQRFTRHVSPLTTTVYTHPSDQELWQGTRGLTC